MGHMRPLQGSDQNALGCFVRWVAHSASILISGSQITVPHLGALKRKA